MRMRMGPAQAGAIIMLILGAVALVASILLTSTPSAFIGLGLIFWGAILLYVQKPDYVPTAVLDASVSSVAGTLNKVIETLDYQGQPVYLSPKYSENPEDTKVFIPKQKESGWPTPEQIQKNKDTPVMSKPAGMLISPPGADLTKLFEKTLGTSFTRVNLQYLERNLPRLLIEDLEVSTSFEMKTETENHVQIETTTVPTLGGPLASAIACALAKATGKPTTIENQEKSQDGSTMRVKYLLHEVEPTE